MSRTTSSCVSRWLAICLVAVLGRSALAGKTTNHAPVLDRDKFVQLTPENWNSGAPAGPVGTLVNTLVDFAVPVGGLDNVTDEDAGAKLGIAVIAADASSGKWFYSINNGSTWSAMGSVATNKARLLAADSATRIYFQPNGNFYGNLDSTSLWSAGTNSKGTGRSPVKGLSHPLVGVATFVGIPRNMTDS